MEKDKDKTDNFDKLDFKAELYASEMKRIRQERIIYILSAIVLIFAIVAFVVIVRSTGGGNVPSAT